MDKAQAIEILSQNGLSREVIEAISIYKEEPQWMREVRLKAYDHYVDRPVPKWGPDLSNLIEDEIRYYVTPESKKTRSWDEVPEDMKRTFDELKIPEAERKFLAGVETQFDSNVVYGRMKDKWESQGVIFTDTDTGIKEYPEIFKKYFGRAIPFTDNKYAALNTAAWSGGSFVYVPKGVKVEIPLQAYFYIQTQNLGQFERTLIIADEGAEVQYVEGCFEKGARVVTKNGIQKIENIAKGDEVLTHNNNWKKVYHTMKREYEGDIYTIKIWGDSGKELNITDEHPLYIAKRTKAEYRNKEFNLEWKLPDEIETGDYLAYPILREDSSKKNHSIEITMRQRNVDKDILVDFPFEKGFFRLLGYFFAEGHVDNEHYITFSFHKSERHLIDDVKQLSKKYFEKEIYENAERQNGITLVLSSTKFARAFANEFGSNIYEKHVPLWVQQAPKDLISEFVKGLWLGDGSYDKDKKYFRLSSISDSIANAYRNCLLRLGIAASLNRNKRKLPRKDLYNVITSARYNERFGEIVGVKTQNGTKEGSALAIDEHYLYLPIKSLNKKKKKTMVYNFSVEEDESYVCEGVISHNCSAPTYSEEILHSGVIELIALKGARIRYTTIQNWSKNVYNLVTQRGLAYDDAVIEWVDCNLGSAVTMKYPSVILAGHGSHGEVLSVAMADQDQHIDSGAKMIHIGRNTSGVITTKSICKDGGRTSYRGLVKVAKGAKQAKTRVICDALILDNESQTDTYPYNEIYEKSARIEHEATVSKVSENQLYYLTSRGLSEEEAGGLIVAGFVEPIAKELPMEYALEMNDLIRMSMRDSVG